jgi:hypothetical protein
VTLQPQTAADSALGGRGGGPQSNSMDQMQSIEQVGESISEACGGGLCRGDAVSRRAAHGHVDGPETRQLHA